MRRPEWVRDERARAKMLERHRRQARALVAWPINLDTVVIRAEIVLVEAPRWKPDEARAKYVGDL